MDGYVDFRIGSPDKPDPKWDVTRQTMGRARKLAERIELAGLVPNTKLASTGYCLASSAGEFRCAVYLPKGGEVSVDLSAVKGSLALEWIEAESGNSPAATDISGGRRQLLAAPFSGPAILRLSQTTSLQDDR